MGAYNVINPASMANGQPEDVTVVGANFAALAALLNGNLDDFNLKAGANIQIAKLLGFPNDITKLLVGNGAWGLPKASVGGDLEQLIRGDGTWGYPRSRVLKTYNGNPLSSRSNSVVEQLLLNGAAGLTVPGGLMGAAGILRIKVLGKVANSSGVSHGFTPRVYVGSGATFETGSLIAWATSANEHIFELEYYINAVDATHQQLAGRGLSDSAVSPSMLPAAAAALAAPKNIDMTAPFYINVGLTNDAALATVTTTVFWATVELLTSP